MISRESLLELMPKGGQVAEIGTYKGLYAQEIRQRVEPDTLHLIDPWEQQKTGDYVFDGSNVDQTTQDAHFAQVKERFGEDIHASRVKLHRGFSGPLAKEFGQNSLDWIYVDGDHSYEGVKADLANYAPKVKEDGFILGHDYVNGVATDLERYGVVQAVNEFVQAEGWSFIALTFEPHATYVLSRNPQGDAAQLLAAKMLYNSPHVIEIRDFPANNYHYKVYDFEDGRKKGIMSF